MRKATRNYVIVFEIGEPWRSLNHFSQLSEALEFVRQRGGTVRTFCFWSSAQYVGTAIALAIEPRTPRPRSKRRSRLSAG
jgi:hypothetical protein